MQLRRFMKYSGMVLIPAIVVSSLSAYLAYEAGHKNTDNAPNAVVNGIKSMPTATDKLVIYPTETADDNIKPGPHTWDDNFVYENEVIEEEAYGTAIAESLYRISESSLNENQKIEAMQRALETYTSGTTRRHADDRIIAAVEILYGKDTAKVIKTYYETGRLDENAYERALLGMGIRAIFLPGPSGSLAEWFVKGAITHLATDAGQQYLHSHFPAELYEPEYDDYGLDKILKDVGRTVDEIIADINEKCEGIDVNKFTNGLLNNGEN